MNVEPLAVTTCLIIASAFFAMTAAGGQVVIVGMAAILFVVSRVRLKQPQRVDVLCGWIVAGWMCFGYMFQSLWVDVWWAHFVSFLAVCNVAASYTLPVQNTKAAENMCLLFAWGVVFSPTAATTLPNMPAAMFLVRMWLFVFVYMLCEVDYEQRALLAVERVPSVRYTKFIKAGWILFAQSIVLLAALPQLALIMYEWMANMDESPHLLPIKVPPDDKFPPPPSPPSAPVDSTKPKKNKNVDNGRRAVTSLKLKTEEVDSIIFDVTNGKNANGKKNM